MLSFGVSSIFSLVFSTILVISSIATTNNSIFSFEPKSVLFKIEISFISIILLLLSISFSLAFFFSKSITSSCV